MTDAKPVLTPEEKAAAARSRLLALITASAFFMQTLDATVITTAIPSMAMTFRVKPSDLSIGITSYMLAVAAVLPMSGWLANRFGPRNVFAAAVVVFTLASVLCALSPDLWSFTAARVLQGAGGALMGPVGRLVVLRNTSKKDLLGAIALIVWPGLTAPVIGPLLGGIIVNYATWPWIFLVNAPIGLAGVILSLRFMPNDRDGKAARFDTPGFVFASGALLGLVGGLEAIAHSAAPLLSIALLILGGAMGYGAVRRFQSHDHPLIPLDATRTHTFAAATLWGGTLSRTAIFGTPFILPLMFQVGFNFSPIRSGTLLLAYFAGNLGIKPFTTPILRRFGFRQVLTVNSVVSGLAIAGCALFSPSSSTAAMSALLLVCGASRSMQFTCLDSLAYADVSPNARAGATTLAGVTMQIAAVLGIAFVAILLNAFAPIAVWRGIAQFDYKLTLVCLGLTCLGALPTYLALARDAGAEVTGHKPA